MRGDSLKDLNTASGATGNSVALQQVSSYQLQRARDSAYKSNTCSATANGVAPAHLTPPGPATILHHCRCADCRHWIREPYNECSHGIIANGLKDPPEFPPDAWHYCALYHGPQRSRDVWAWPRTEGQEKKGPAPGGGGPGGGPIQSGLVGGEPAGRTPLYPAEPESVPPSCDSGRQAAQVGAGSKDSGPSAQAADSQASAALRQPLPAEASAKAGDANGSFAAVSSGDARGNSRHNEHSLFCRKIAARRQP